MKKYEYIATGGETGFTDPILIGKTILSVEKDGVGFTKIISGAPTDKHVQYLNYTGTINFKSALTPGEYILVLYQDNGDVCFPVDLQTGFTLPDGVAGFPYSASFYVVGTAPFTMSAPVKPSWLSVTLSSNLITFSGTPAIGDTGSNAVSFTLTNACGTVDFAQSFNVSALDAVFEPFTYVGGDRLTDTEIANLSGTPGVVVTVTLTTLDNTNGGTLKVNGTTAALSDTWNVTLTTSGATLDVEIDGVTNSGTVIRGIFTITSVSAGAIGLPKTYQISKVF
jgi:hypothetical protein